MTMNLKNLELFVRTAATGAIGRAGQDLGLSSTNASQRLQTLEESLAVKLLNRTTRAVSLTPDGEVFLDHAKRILAGCRGRSGVGHVWYTNQIEWHSKSNCLGVVCTNAHHTVYP